jgi:hypothetical protein
MRTETMPERILEGPEPLPFLTVVTVLALLVLSNGCLIAEFMRQELSNEKAKPHNQCLAQCRSL